MLIEAVQHSRLVKNYWSRYVDSISLCRRPLKTVHFHVSHFTCQDISALPGDDQRRGGSPLTKLSIKPGKDIVSTSAPMTVMTVHRPTAFLFHYVLLLLSYDFAEVYWTPAIIGVPTPGFPPPALYSSVHRRPAS